MNTTSPQWPALEGRVCVVTGAASGIGAATAQALADAGAAVALVDLDADAARETACRIADERGTRVIGVGCDISDEAAVRDAAVTMAMSK